MLFFQVNIYGFDNKGQHYNTAFSKSSMQWGSISIRTDILFYLSKSSERW